jgi:hypothetical protein
MENLYKKSEDETYSKNVAAGSYILGHTLMKREDNSDRKEKMQNVLDRKETLLNETFGDGSVSEFGEVARLLDPGGFTTDEVKTYFIDMAFSNPFSPYEINYEEDDFTYSLKQLSHYFDISKSEVESILDTKREAISAHEAYDWLKIAGYGAVGVVALGLGGYFLAPALGAALGGAAGLAGAAATAHGLALLGGGTMAAGGAGMAGGM